MIVALVIAIKIVAVASVAVVQRSVSMILTHIVILVVPLLLLLLRRCRSSTIASDMVVVTVVTGQLVVIVLPSTRPRVNRLPFTIVILRGTVLLLLLLRIVDVRAWTVFLR